ncbi:MFS transporter [Glycomyces harbinensis]|uniref:Predicted arabinose efflux permease, MFS family n=1 Tax=Glycomyces harbinensis TaxID=58114 RepID=A0A1G7A0Z1_9ACTN|nr:MFS transporter [Glycomyces harbinensis]SDE07566.1 Predicted arabinose efflux permease, MFS family [Glycomyces harbinensis]
MPDSAASTPAASNPASSIRLRRLALPIYGPTVLISIGMGAVVPLIALSALDLGATVTQAAIIVGLIGFGQLCGDLPAGALTQRFGEKRVLLAACVVEAAALIVASQTSSLAVLAASVFSIGLSSAVFGLARHAYLSEAVAFGFRARALSTLGGTFRIGSFIGPFVGALLIEQHSFGATYAFAAGTSLAGGLLSLALPDLPRTARVDAPAPEKRSLWAVLAEHKKVFATAGTGVFLIMIARASRQAIIPLWAALQGLDATTTSIIFGLAAGVDMLLFYPGGAIMDRFGRMWVALPAMIVMGAGFLLLPLSGTALTIGLVACFMGLGNGISSGIVLTIGSDVAPDEGRRQFLGGWRLCADLGNVAGPGLISLVSLAFPLGAAAIALGLITWFGAGWLAKWVPVYDPARRVKASA